jgi:protein SCO1
MPFALPARLMSSPEPVFAEAHQDAALAVSVDASRRHHLRHALSLALGIMGVGLSACDKAGVNPMEPPKLKFSAVDITGAEYGKDLNLPDTTGKKRSLTEFRGKVVVVFFGFTQCPDVCPTTMAQMAELRRKLGPQGDKLQGIFVSIDPERDTPEVLAEYTKALDPSFVALRGSLDEIKQAASSFKVFYQKVPTADGKSYTMDHTAGSFVFDPQGHLRLFVRYGMTLAQLEGDVRQLLAVKA